MRLWILLLVFLLVAASSAVAQVPIQFAQVKATGIGMNRQEAVQAALQTAVESVVGTYLDVRTTVQGKSVVAQQIVAHSQGYIESYRILQEATGPVFRVLLLVTVRDMRIQQMLHSDSALPLDGPQLVARSSSKQQMDQSAQQLVLSTLQDYASSFRFTIGSREVEIDTNGQAVLVLKDVSAKLDPEYRSKLVGALEEISSEQAPATDRILDYTATRPIALQTPTHFCDPGQSSYILLSNDPHLSATCFLVASSTAHAVAVYENQLWPLGRWLLMGHGIGRGSLRVVLSDSRGSVVSATEAEVVIALASKFQEANTAAGKQLGIGIPDYITFPRGIKVPVDAANVAAASSIRLSWMHSSHMPVTLN